MFSLIVFTSFALFMWATIIAIIYKAKLKKYSRLKKQFKNEVNFFK